MRKERCRTRRGCAWNHRILTINVYPVPVTCRKWIQSRESFRCFDNVANFISPKKKLSTLCVFLFSTPALSSFIAPSFFFLPPPFVLLLLILFPLIYFFSRLFSALLFIFLFFKCDFILRYFEYRLLFRFLTAKKKKSQLTFLKNIKNHSKKAGGKKFCFSLATVTNASLLIRESMATWYKCLLKPVVTFCVIQTCLYSFISFWNPITLGKT